MVTRARSDASRDVRDAIRAGAMGFTTSHSRDGEHTGALPGQLLRGPAARRR